MLIICTITHITIYFDETMVNMCLRLIKIPNLFSSKPIWTKPIRALILSSCKYEIRNSQHGIHLLLDSCLDLNEPYSGDTFMAHHYFCLNWEMIRSTGFGHGHPDFPTEDGNACRWYNCSFIYDMCCYIRHDVCMCVQFNSLNRFSLMNIFNLYRSIPSVANLIGFSTYQPLCYFYAVSDDSSRYVAWQTCNIPQCIGQ